MYQAPAAEASHEHPEHVCSQALGSKETPGYHRADSICPAIATQRQQEGELPPQPEGPELLPG